MFRKLCYYGVEEENLIEMIRLAKENYNDIMIKGYATDLYSIYGKPKPTQ